MALFGGMPYAIQFFLAFVVVLGLIGASAWAVRRFGGGRLGRGGLRGRQPRLAVIEYANVDGRRQLILLRRDNVEHLVMVGGPSDLVVESNIVRAVAVPRELPLSRPVAPAEPMPRIVSLPDVGGHAGWPLQPEAVAPPAAPRLQRSDSASEEPAPVQPPGEAPSGPARTQRDTLAALAEELSASSPPTRPRPAAGARQQPQESRAPGSPHAGSAAESDRNLAEMAHRLEAALRNPNAKVDGREARAPADVARPVPSSPEPARPAAAAPASPVGSAPLATQAPPASPPRAAEPSARADAKPAKANQALYDSLEEEMASLLGRPTGKN